MAELDQDDEAKAAMHELEIDLFIAENDLNEKASMALRAAPPAVQKYVLHQGPLANVLDRSADLLGRLHKARVGGGVKGRTVVVKEEDGTSGGVRTRPQGIKAEHRPAAAEADVVERFIQTNYLNDGAAEKLRTASASVQRAVVARGSLRSCRDPSAACVGRIRDTSQGQNQESTGAQGGGDPTDVEHFIFTYGVQGRAADVLRYESEMVQSFVLGSGALDVNVDPSAACLARVGKFYRATSQFARRGGSGKISEQEAKNFIASNSLNEDAAAALRAASQAVQEMTIGRGSLQGHANPSDACLDRIHHVQLYLEAVQEFPESSSQGRPSGGVKRAFATNSQWQDEQPPKTPRPTSAASLRKVVEPPMPPRPPAAARQPSAPPPWAARTSAEVRFETPEAAWKAVQELDGSKLGRVPISVTLDSMNREGTKILLQGVPLDVGKMDLKEHFGGCGKVVFAGVIAPAGPGSTTVTGEVRFETAEEAAAAQPLLDGITYPGGSVVSACFDRTSKDGSKVILRGLPRGTEWQELKDFAAQAGRVAFAGFIGCTNSPTGAFPVAVPQGNAGGMAFAEVRFESPKEAQRAVSKLDKSVFHGCEVAVSLDLASKDMSKVIIRGLPAGAEWQDLKDHCNKAGRVAFVEVKPFGVAASSANSPASTQWSADVWQQQQQPQFQQRHQRRRQQTQVKEEEVDTGLMDPGDVVGSVRFETSPMAMQALQLDGSVTRGSVISVALDAGKGPGRILVTGLSAGTRSQELRNLFSRCGKVISADVTPRAGGGQTGDWF